MTEDKQLRPLREATAQDIRKALEMAVASWNPTDVHLMQFNTLSFAKALALLGFGEPYKTSFDAIGRFKYLLLKRPDVVQLASYRWLLLDKLEAACEEATRQNR